MDEVERAYAKDADVPRKMVEYLVGVKDYYKIVSKDKQRLTVIHTFNMHKTLNQETPDCAKVQVVPEVEWPTKMLGLQFRNGSQNTFLISANHTLYFFHTFRKFCCNSL